MSDQKYDVVIVGAGIAGALVAWQLGRRGVKVLLLEAGPPNRGMADRLDWLNVFKENPIKTTNSPYPASKAAPFPNAANIQSWNPETGIDDPYWLELPEDNPAMGPVDQPSRGRFSQWDIINPATAQGSDFQSTNLRKSGGTTWHWLGTSLRLTPHTYKLKSAWNPIVEDPNYGRSTAEDWPISYDDVEPWYNLAEKDIGVAGPRFGEEVGYPTQSEVGGNPRQWLTWRSQPYPMPEVPQSYMDKQIEAAIAGLTFEDAGYQGRPHQYPYSIQATPQARNTTPGYGGRPQCKGSTSCIPICPIQAKYDATQHLELAKQTGNVDVREAAVAYQVDLDDPAKTNPSVTAIRYLTYDPVSETRTGEGVAQGKIFVMAAHAIENPKILLSSPWGDQGQVANSSGTLGLYLADHPVSLIYALLDDPVYPYRGPLSTSGIPAFRDGPFRHYRGGFRMEIGNGGWVWPTYGPYGTPVEVMTRYGQTVTGMEEAGEVPVYGRELARQVRDLVSRQTRFGCLIEQLPQKEFWIKPATDPEVARMYNIAESDQRTSLGLPRPLLKYGIDEYARRGLAASVAACVQVYRRMIQTPWIQFNYRDNAGNLVVDWPRTDAANNGQRPDTGFQIDPATGQPVGGSAPYGGYNIFVREGWAGAGHIMGTHRMGSDAATSVVDWSQRSWDHPNLYLLGSGNWPSYGNANPTLTIAALAEWAASSIQKQLRGEARR